MSVLPQLDQFNFHHTLEATPGVSLVLFTGPACGACRQVKALLAAHADEFARVNLFEVNAEQDMGLVNEFAVFHLPALFLFHEGHFHAELHSEPRVRALLDAIDHSLSQPAQEAP